MSAPVFQIEFTQDIKKPVLVQHCGNVVFTGDNLSDTISVSVLEDGEPYAISGTVAMNCIRADGATVTVTGSVSGNTASATLTQACVAIPGPLAVVIKVTSDSTTTTLLKAVYMVDVGVTGTAVDPGTIIPDVTTLINAIETAVGSIPADYSDLLATIAPNFSSGTYSAGSYVWNNGTLYRFTADHSGSWTGTDVEAVVIGDELTNLKSALSQGIADVQANIDEMIQGDDSDADLDIVDEEGNALARFRSGHFQTKEFDSKMAVVPKSENSSADLDITDINGNTLVRFEDGNFETKNFKSTEFLSWRGKKWAVVGDSLTEVNQTSTKRYYEFIAEPLGMTVYNCARSGCGYGTEDPTHYHVHFSELCEQIPDDADVITIFGSINDLSSGKEIGDPADSGDTTLCGCMNAAIDYVQTHYPLAPLGIVAPCPWKNCQPNDTNSTVTWCESYVAALKAVCMRRGVPFLDLYHGSNMYPSNAVFRSLCYTNDGVDGGTHPSILGHKILSSKFFVLLKQLMI